VTYTEEQVNERHSKLDRTIARLTRERDALKSGHESISSQLAELQMRIDGEDEAKYKDRPDELDILQKRKKLREAQMKFESEVKELEAEKASWSERLKEFEAEQFNLTVFEMAEGVGGDATRLRTVAQKYGITDRDKLKDLASDLWPKSPIEVPPVDSGGTAGGGADWSKKSPEEKIAEGLRRDRARK
jgi:hypothetical protein